jgi:hypothetical protein
MNTVAQHGFVVKRTFGVDSTSSWMSSMPASLRNSPVRAVIDIGTSWRLCSFF